jgi:hypothetical protein
MASDLRAGIAGVLVLAAVVTSACSSSVTLTKEPVTKRTFTAQERRMSVELGSLQGHACFRDELVQYLAMPGGIQFAKPGEDPDFTLEGTVSRIEVHSNRGDKELSIAYFTAFVITAPIAAAMYWMKDWHADAAADGELSALARDGKAIWTKRLTVSISETQRTLPTRQALNTAMEAAVCQKLAISLIDALTEAITANPRHRGALIGSCHAPPPGAGVNR